VSGNGRDQEIVPAADVQRIHFAITKFIPGCPYKGRDIVRLCRDFQLRGEVIAAGVEAVAEGWGGDPIPETPEALIYTLRRWAGHHVTQIRRGLR
jgi:hypothetical protein